jgi:heptosyltransferase III
MRAIRRAYWRLLQEGRATARQAALGFHELTRLTARMGKPVHVARATSQARAHVRELNALRTHVNASHPQDRGPTLVAISLIEHMGDIVAAEPIARLVRKMHSDALVIWVVRAPYADLAASNPSIDKTLVVSCMTEWIYLRRAPLFDVIFDLHVRGRVCPVCRIPLEKPEGNPQINMVNYFEFGGLLSVQCQSAGLPVIDDQPCIHIPESAVQRVDALSLPPTFVAVHCRATEPSKDWDKGKWKRLALWLEEHAIPCIEVGTTPALAADPLRSYRNLCRKLTILETAEVIRRAALFIGIDSGPAHLANAVGTFGILIFGQYRQFKTYSPYSGRYRSGENAEMMFASGPASGLSIDHVKDAVRRHWSSSTVFHAK